MKKTIFIHGLMLVPMLLTVCSLLYATKTEKNPWWISFGSGPGVINSKSNQYTVNIGLGFTDDHKFVYLVGYNFMGGDILFNARYKSSGLRFQVGRILFESKRFNFYPAAGIELASMKEGIGELTTPGLFGGEYESYETNHMFYLPVSVTGQWKLTEHAAFFVSLEAAFSEPYTGYFVNLGLRMGRYRL